MNKYTRVSIMILRCDFIYIDDFLYGISEENTSNQKGEYLFGESSHVVDDMNRFGG